MSRCYFRHVRKSQNIEYNTQKPHFNINKPVRNLNYRNQCKFADKLFYFFCADTDNTHEPPLLSFFKNDNSSSKYSQIFLKMCAKTFIYKKTQHNVAFTIFLIRGLIRVHTVFRLRYILTSEYTSIRPDVVQSTSAVPQKFSRRQERPAEDKSGLIWR